MLGGGEWVVDPAGRPELQDAMTRGVGVLRSADSLAVAATALTRLGAGRGRPNTDSWEATNLLTVATTLLAAAYARQETRGSHWREDFPDASPDWLGHIVGCIAVDGVRRQQWEALDAQ